MPTTNPAINSADTLAATRVASPASSSSPRAISTNGSAAPTSSATVGGSSWYALTARIEASKSPTLVPPAYSHTPASPSRQASPTSPISVLLVIHAPIRSGVSSARRGGGSRSGRGPVDGCGQGIQTERVEALAVDGHRRSGLDAPVGGGVGVQLRPVVVGAVPDTLRELFAEPHRVAQLDELIIGEARPALLGLVGEQRRHVRIQLARVGGAAGRGRGAGGVPGGRVPVQDRNWPVDHGHRALGQVLLQDRAGRRVELLTRRTHEVQVDLDWDRSGADR